MHAGVSSVVEPLRIAMEDEIADIEDHMRSDPHSVEPHDEENLFVMKKLLKKVKDLESTAIRLEWDVD